MDDKAPRFFYGWVVVAASTAIVAVGLGLLFSLGVFMEPLEQAFGWRREQIGRASLFGWLAFGLGSFLFGALSDRLGTRTVASLGGLLLGFGMLALSHLQQLWQLYLFYGLLVGGSAGAFMVPLTSTVTRWFTARRGLVVALANCGIGLGGMVFAPLTRYLIMDLGWRTAFLLYAVLAWSLVLPLALLIRNRPQDLGLSPLGDAAAAPVSPPGYPFRAVITTSAFWRLAGIHFLCCAAHSGPIFHMVSAAIDHGIDKLAAATVFGLASLASIPGRIGTGLLADRFGSRRVLVLWLAMQASAILLYRRSGSLASFVLLALYFGVAYGGVMPLYAVVTREFFGARAMGSSYGAIFLLSCFGMGFGGWVGGRLFDVTGTYSAMYLLSFGLATAGALLAVALRPPAAGRRRAAQWQPATTT